MATANIWLFLIPICFCICEGAVTGNNGSNDVNRSFDPKSVLTGLASNIMSRGFVGGGTTPGASQVVSLNLTNLLVLVLLKALIFAAGSIGAGTWKGGLGRSLNGEERLITDEEVILFLSYLTASPGDYGCLQSIACQQPEQAKRYAAAGDMLLKTARMLSINADENYDLVLRELEGAASYGYRKGDCKRYTCGSV